MNKAEYLNIVEKNVRDDAKNFVKTAVISAVSYSDPVTTFTVDSISGFYAGDNIYLKDSATTYFGVIKEIDETNNYIKIQHDLHLIALGTQIKKNDAEQYLDNAMLVYSKFRWLVKSQDYSGLAQAQEIALPTDWQQGFSSISDIRFPLSSTKITYIDNRYYRIILNESGVYKIFFDYAITGDARVIFQARHSFNATTYIATVPDTDVYAVCDLASAYYMLALASRFAQSTNMDSLGADVVNYDQKPNQYIILYNNYLNKAAMWLNIDVDQLKKGGAIDEAYSSNQEIDEEISDDNVLIHTNYFNY